MAQRFTILEYANIKDLTVHDVIQNAKEKGVILPEYPEYVLDDSQLKQVDPIFAHQNKYKHIKFQSSISSNESDPNIFTLKSENQINKDSKIKVPEEIHLSALNQSISSAHELNEKNKKNIISKKLFFLKKPLHS